ncbi:MAG: metallophosphoesterase [Gemmatimonadetes bacterium]|nr:metallophosphoesterase [Gemmatimonadota bacterium]
MLISRRAALTGLATGGIGLVAGAAAYGGLYARHQLQLVRASLPVSGLPPALDGLRVGLITDLHHSRMVAREDVEAAVDLMLSARPDLIVLGGDFITTGQREFITPCAEALARLTAPHGVFAALGNHDDDRGVPAALKKQGIAVLMDQRARIEINHEPLEIAGLLFWTQRASAIARVLEGATAPVLLMAHDPRRLRQAAALDVGLVLSGHTHGGQVVLPGLGAIGARRFPVLSGTARSENTTIFVSRGVGTVYVPYRLNCPPDVALLTLNRLSRLERASHPTGQNHAGGTAGLGVES